MGRFFSETSIGLGGKGFIGNFPHKPSQQPVLWTATAISPAQTYDTLTNAAGTLIFGTNVFGNTLTSNDGGQTWAAGVCAANTTVSDSLAYGGGYWLYSYSGQPVLSSDLVNWTKLGVYPIQPNGDIAIFANGNGRWIALGGQSADFSYSPTTPPQVNQAWTHPGTFAITGSWGGGSKTCIFDGTQFVTTATPTASGKPSICTSPDGINWAALPITYAASAYFTLATNFGLYLLMPSGPPAGLLIGFSWADVAAAGLTQIVFANGDTGLRTATITTEGRIVAVGNYGSVATSIDNGKTWVEDIVPWNHTAGFGTAFNFHAAVDGANVIMTEVGAATVARRVAL